MLNKWGDKYRYSWDADNTDEYRLTLILLIINKINLHPSAYSESSASGNINLPPTFTRIG
ncbi:hypothetical protein B5F96_12650 [Parabacteroides johnsonii]|uniref:Uncharacterized protein n=1 Tax=Parabacteroides johnsonii TaxID=387661 RepID=A0A9Q5SQX7_9BACT|nr:hypothetical protein B5F96_12650 [Parabacteroides johnsonii]